MPGGRAFMRWAAVSGFLTAIFVTGIRSPAFEFHPSDKICIVGNTLAERMQHAGWLETLLQVRYPDHDLVFRNLGFSGDELTIRLRSKDFGTPDEWLTRCRASVVIACFGYNESFAGRKGLDRFRRDLRTFVERTRGQKFDGASPPRLVLVTPIPHEDLHHRHLPSGNENNERLQLYATVIQELGEELEVPVVDLFRQLVTTAEPPLTINGIHLNDAGNRRAAELIVDTLCVPRDTTADESRLERVRQAVLDKNFHWFQRYRTTDGYSIFGGRADLQFTDGQTNREVMQREMEILDSMTANRDRAIWAAAQGRDVQVDDSNTPEFVPVVSNKPGPLPGGEHEFLSGEDAIGRMTFPDDLRINLFASEAEFPELASPVQMAFDPQGRLWVAAWPSYPHWKPKDKMDDKLLVFSDENGDGRADTMQVFAGGLHNPTGFELWGDGVLVAQAPDVMYLRDTDGDGRADVRQRILHGIDSADTHHTANSFTLGPGGDLFFQEGTFHHTQVETPWRGPVRSANAAVFRFEPRTFKFHVYVAYNFANPHGHVFDRWGQDFVTDGTGNVNYYATPFSGRLEFPQKHTAYFPFFQQRVRPCGGTEILSSDHFPKEFQGNYLNANVIGFQGILRYRMEEDGSGFRGVELDPIVQSSDPNFRPVDIEMGPDGAIYFLDWQNPIIGHMQHNIRDPNRDTVHGRVYRVTHRDRPLQAPVPIARAPISQLLQALQHRSNRVRHRARIELSRHHSDDVVTATVAWLNRLAPEDPDYAHHQLEGLWVFQQHDIVNEPLLREVLASPEPRARAAAIRVLCCWRDRLTAPLELLRQFVRDDFPRVRLEAVRACSFFDTPLAAEVALESVPQAMDKFQRYCLRETLRALEPHWMAVVTSGQPFAADNPDGIKFLLTQVVTDDLLAMHRSRPVLVEILRRDAVAPDVRRAALVDLAARNQSDAAGELVDAISRLDRDDSVGATAVLADLAHLTAAHERDAIPLKDLRRYRSEIHALADHGQREMTRQWALATLVDLERSIAPWWHAGLQDKHLLRDLLHAIPLVGTDKLRADFQPRLISLLQQFPAETEDPSTDDNGCRARFVRIELPGPARTMTLAEVEVVSLGRNVALLGSASQSGTAYGGVAARAIDGNTSGAYADGGQTHTPENVGDPWWELDLGEVVPIHLVRVWNRDEQNGKFARRLDGFRILLLDEARRTVLIRSDIPAPDRIADLVMAEHDRAVLMEAAIAALPSTGTGEAASFRTLASLLLKDEHRSAVIQSLARLPRRAWDESLLEPMVANIVAGLAATPTELRTEPDAIDALSLARQLTSAMPRQAAEMYRGKLRELGVNVLLLRPVPHMITYDRSDLYVEAGQPAQIVFDNIDVMPHNVVIARPGSLARVGLAAERMGPSAYDRHFVPDLSDVLHATKLLQPGQQEKLTFVAPTQQGDYPYLCTFPGHWRRMYGTLHVVENLDEIPAEVLIANSEVCVATRPFVRNWQVSDVGELLSHASSRRQLRRGQTLFQELSCHKCHRLQDDFPSVGPNLGQLAIKLRKGETSRQEILQSMLDPSAKIAPEYKTATIISDAGKIYSGIIASRNDNEMVIIPSPLEREDKIRIELTEIEEEIESQISLMPQGLMNTLTADEILDLVAYIESGADS